MILTPRPGYSVITYAGIQFDSRVPIYSDPLDPSISASGISYLALTTYYYGSRLRIKFDPDRY